MRTLSTLLTLVGTTAILSGVAQAQSCPSLTPGALPQTISFSRGTFKISPIVNGLEIEVDYLSPVSGETEIQKAQAKNDGSGPNYALIQANHYSFDSGTVNFNGEVSAALGIVIQPDGRVDIGAGSKEDNFLIIAQGTQLTCLPYPAQANFGPATREITLVDASIVGAVQGFQNLRADLNQCTAERTGFRGIVDAQSRRIAELEGEVRSLQQQLTVADQRVTTRSIFDARRMIAKMRRTAVRAIRSLDRRNALQQMQLVRKRARIAMRATKRNIAQGDTVISVKLRR